MKSKMFTRFLKMLLTLMMAVTILPMNVYANTENEQLPDTSEEIVEEVNVEEESKEEVTPDEGEQEVVPESGDEVVEGEETSEEDVEVTPPTDEVIDVNQTPADEQEEVTPPENPDTTDDETDNPVVEDPVENPDDTVIDETVEGEEIPVVEDETTGENDELNSENEADQGSAISALYGLYNYYAYMTAGDEYSIQATTDSELEVALNEANTYINSMMNANNPASVVSTWGSQFSWDNEKRESANKSYLFEWSYYNGVVFEGLDYLYDVTGDEIYSEYVTAYLSNMVNSTGDWTTLSNGKQAAGYVDYHGVDCYKTASLLIDYYLITGDQRYLTMANTLYSDLQDAQSSYTSSSRGGNYNHTWKSGTTYNVWLDGLYMVQPFMAEYAAYTNDTAEIERIVDRLTWVSENMYNESTGLFYHAANSSTDYFNNNNKYWGRAIGWYAAALVDVMDHMEGDNLETLTSQLVKLIDGMAPYQTEDGMWRQYVNDSSSTKETSVTSLVAYAIMKAVNNGWIDESYADMATRAFVGMTNYSLDDSGLHYISFKGSTSGYSDPSYSSYVNEGKGLGPFIMAYAEVYEYVNGTVTPEEPEVPETPVVPEDQEVTVGEVTMVVGGLTDKVVVTEVSNEDKELIEAKEYDDYFAVDMSAVIADGETVTITVDVPFGWDYTRMVGISVEDGVVKEIPGTHADGKFSFTVDHFSAKGYALTPLAEGVNTGTGNLVGGIVYTLDTNGVTANKKYLIVNTNDDEGYALTNNGSNTPGSTTVTIQNGTITVEEDDNIAWTFSGSTSGTVNNNNRYIYLGSNSVLSTSSRNLSIGNKGNGAYTIARSTEYYLEYYSSWYNSGWRRSEDESNVYLFEYTGESSGEEVVFTIEPSSLSLKPGETVDLTGTVKVGGETVALEDCTIKWGSGNSTIASISKDTMTVTGKADGSTNITVTLSAVNGVDLQEDIELTVPVTVLSKQITNVELSDYEGNVYRDCKTTTQTGTHIIITYDDGTTKEEHVTVSMLSGDFDIKEEGTYSGLTVTYEGNTFDNYTLIVNPKAGNNYPEYPDPGAVDVNKVVSDLSQFQVTGVAQIELSTSGIPVHTGVNTILIMDISNSMSWDDTEYDYNDTAVTAGSNQRLNVAKTSAKTFVNTLLADNEDGSSTMNTVTILAFAGIDGDFNTHNTAKDNDDVYQVGNLAMDNVKDAEAAIEELVKATTGGTNYDYAFQQAYDLAIDLYELNGQMVHIVFMTDGAPTHYNGVYYKSRNNTDLTACMQYVDPTTGETSVYTSTGNDRNGKDIDATATQQITVYYNDGTTANKNVTYNKGWSDYVIGNLNGWAEKTKALDEVAKVYSIGFGMKNGSVTQGATSSMPTLSNVNGGQYYIPYTTTKAVLQHIASSSEDYYEADNTEELSALYASLANEIKQAATEAYFVDQMGDSFNVHCSSFVEKFIEDGDDVQTKIEVLNPAPAIEVKTYSVYKRSDIGKVVNGVTVTEAMVGERYGSGSVIETVVFNAEGTEAYSSVDGYTSSTKVIKAEGDSTVTATVTDHSGTNIIEDGIIVARSFWYNTTSENVMIDTDGDGEKEYSLDPETFYWNIGTIRENEYALTYYVYLEGSAEGKATEGSYKTNNYATLYYKNWLDNDASQGVSSPSAAWQGAQVHYAFYLVHPETGLPVVNQSTGKTGSFYDAVKVTQPVFYDRINLNETNEVTIEAVADDVLPVGYELFDEGAKYRLVIDSDNGQTSVSGWEIASSTRTSEDKSSTYITGYNGNYASNNEKVEDITYDYTNTTVWFAVMWKKGTVPDTVVVDYGLPVDISVLANDMFGNNGTLIGVGSSDNKPVTTALQYTDVDSDSFVASYTNDEMYGSAEIKVAGVTDVVNGSKVRYTLKSMNMDAPDYFSYEVKYAVSNGDTTTGYQYYYGDITVIPATTIYFEDDFSSLSYQVHHAIGKTAELTSWESTGARLSNVTQAEDRPGNYSLPSIDANNLYGYDQSYKAMNEYSLGSAYKVNVNADQYATATFDFVGTGFDVISMTSNTTGTILVSVYSVVDGVVSTNPVKKVVVDTYYGYEYVDGEWVVSESDTENALYQIPVMKINDLTYSNYHVEIKAVYDPIFAHGQYDGTNYDFYLDAIRIYNSAMRDEAGNITNSDIQNAYEADSERWPTYFELRNHVIGQDTFEKIESNDVGGVVFIDGINETASITDYKNYGPNNELYLAGGQAISFTMDDIANVETIQIAVKTVGGSTTYKIYDVDLQNLTNATTYTLDTSTDMYYDITRLNGKNVVIANTGTSILSITNIKVTYTENPYGIQTESYSPFLLRRAAVNLALASLEPVVEDEVETPDVSNPEIDTPEINNPEVDPDTPVVEPETPNTGNTGTTTPETGNTEDNTSSVVTGPEAPEGGESNEGKPSTDNTVESEGTDTETEVTPDNGTTEDKETVTPDTPVEETPETEVEEQLGFFASLIKMIVDFFVSMFSWLIGLVA